MNESDIKEVISILKNGIKSKDWDDIREAKDYLEEFLEDTTIDDDEY